MVTSIGVDRAIEERQPVVYRSPVGKEYFRPPERLGTDFHPVYPTEFYDRVRLTVLIFQRLMEGNHAFSTAQMGQGEMPMLSARIAMGPGPYQTHPPDPVKTVRGTPPIAMLPSALTAMMERGLVAEHCEPAQRPAATG